MADEYQTFSQNDLPELLTQYYKRLFPYKYYYQWLSYGAGEYIYFSAGSLLLFCALWPAIQIGDRRHHTDSRPTHSTVHVYLKPGFHYRANATTTTQKQSDYRVEQSSFTLIALF